MVSVHRWFSVVFVTVFLHVPLLFIVHFIESDVKLKAA